MEIYKMKWKSTTTKGTPTNDYKIEKELQLNWTKIISKIVDQIWCDNEVELERGPGGRMRQPHMLDKARLTGLLNDHGHNAVDFKSLLRIFKQWATL